MAINRNQYIGATSIMNITRTLLAFVFLINQVFSGISKQNQFATIIPRQSSQESLPFDNGYPPPIEVTATPTPDSSLTPTTTPTQATLVPNETPVPTVFPTVQPTEVVGDTGGDSTNPDAVLTLTADEEFYVPGDTITLEWVLQQPDSILDPTLVIYYPEGLILQTDPSGSITQNRPDISNMNNPAGQLSLQVDITENSGNLVFLTGIEMKQSLHFSAVVYDGAEPVYLTGIKIKVAKVLHVTDVETNTTGHLGRIKLKIPEGALSSNATFYTYDTDPEDPPNSLTGNPITIVARQDDTGIPIDHFEQPITIEYQFNDLDYPSGDEENLSLFYFSEEENTWIPLPSLVDTKNNIVTGYSDHLTVFDIDVNKWEAARLPTMEGFQTSLFTGAATYSYPFEVPSGPAGLQP